MRRHLGTSACSGSRPPCCRRGARSSSRWPTISGRSRPRMRDRRHPPPAPIASVPEVTPVRTYLVFFDWDRAELSARARQIVATAAEASTHVQTTRIEVNGYTDLSGTAAYNQKLSDRRASTVKTELETRRRAERRDLHSWFWRERSARPDRPRCARAAEPPGRDRDQVIPTRLKTDTRPLARADRRYACGVGDEPVPGGFARLDNLVVAVPDQGAEFVLAQIVPDILHRI